MKYTIILLLVLFTNASNAWVFNGVELKKINNNIELTVDDSIIKIKTPTQFTYNSFSYIDYSFDDSSHLTLKTPVISNIMLISKLDAKEIIEKMKKNKTMYIEGRDYNNNEFKLKFNLSNFEDQYCTHIEPFIGA